MEVSVPRLSDDIAASPQIVLAEYSIATSNAGLYAGVTRRAILKGTAIAFAAFVLMQFGAYSGTAFGVSPACFMSMKIEFQTIHSARLAPPTSGDHLIVAASPSADANCQSIQTGSFFVVLDVRDPDGVTELLDMEKVTPANSTIPSAGFSWVPLEGGLYSVRAFAVNGLEKPAALSSITASNLTITKSPGESIVSVLPAQYSSHGGNQSYFSPDYIKVVLGVNSTLRWTNGDTIGHFITGQKVFSNTSVEGISFQAAIEPDSSFTYTYIQPGLYQYHDDNNPSLLGYIEVIAPDVDESSVLHHDLSLLVTANQTSAPTESTILFSVYLVNNASHPEHVSIEDNSMMFYKLGVKPGGHPPPCLYGNHTYYLPVSDFGYVVPAGGRLAISEDVPTLSPNTPSMYVLNGPIVVSVADQAIDNSTRQVTQSCLDVFPKGSPAINVTAAQYQGVHLVVSTDKEAYLANETVSFSLQIVNDGDKPFVVREVQPAISVVRETTGRQVFGLGYVADYVSYPVIPPHSSYSFHDGVLTWNQQDLEDKARVQPGQYRVTATFTDPYLASDPLEITIQ